MSMPEQLVKTAVTGADGAAGKVLATKVLEALLGDAKLSKPAQDAIQAMQHYFFSNATPHDFITPLRRTGIFVGKDPFKKTESFAYLGGKIEANHNRLPALTNMNLKEAAILLWNLQCQIALHIMYRRDNNFERSDADHSYVLMYMQESVSTAMEMICNKPDLTDDEVHQLKTKIQEGLVKAFHNYIQNTQAEQSSGARRTAIDHNVRETMEKVGRALDRFITEKPLRTSIDALQQTAQSFYLVLKQMLLAVVLVPRQEGEKQQDAAWVLPRKMVLAKAAQSNYESMLIYLQEDKATTTGYQGKSGVLYMNPFAERVYHLLLNEEPSQDKSYFHYIMEVFALIEKSHNEQAEQALKNCTDLFSTTYNKLPRSESFLLKDLLQEGHSEVKFIRTTILLYRQSHELARFMAALQHFMQLVGKLGLYSNPELHTQLTHLIQAASTTLEHNLSHMYSFVRQGSEARVGGWLNPIDEMLQQLKRQGNSIAQELQSFQGHFAKIIDPAAMQMEFNKSKVALLQAALGLGHASQIDKHQMDAIAQHIGSTSFEQFIEPMHYHTSQQESSTRLIEILALAQDMQQRLDCAETNVSELRAQHDVARQELSRIKAEMDTHEDALKTDSARLQAKAVELKDHVQKAETKLIEIDQVVYSFGQRVKQQLGDLNNDSAKDVEEANHLMEAARMNLASSSSHALSEQMTLLSRLKGRLEERQKSYQKLVESVSAFQTEYTVKRGTVSIALTNVQEVAKDIDRTVLELVAKINALTDIISCLRHTLDEKDRQLAQQQAKLLDLEAQLASLRVRKGSVGPRTSALHDEAHRTESELLPSDLSRSSRPSSINFMQSISRNHPLSSTHRIQRAIEVYGTDIHHGRFVRNKARKVVKYAIWNELNGIVFENKEVSGELTNLKELIIGAIKNLQRTNFSIQTEKDVYVYSYIVRGKSEEDIYQEFLKGKDTQAALKDLNRAFLDYLDHRNNNSLDQFSLDTEHSTKRYNSSNELHFEP